MTTHWSRISGIAGLILACATTQSVAAPIALIGVTGRVTFSCTTGTGGFEHYCSKGENIETGYFRLVYDPLIPDSDHGSTSGLFRAAIRSFEMGVSQVNRPHLTFSLVGRGDLHRDSRYNDWVTWEMTLKEINDVVAPSIFWFNMYQPGWSGINPNVMPALDFWSPTLIGYVVSGGVEETDWLYPGSIDAGTDPRSVPIPLPPSSWLLLIGAAGVIFQSQRQRVSVRACRFQSERGSCDTR